MKNRNNMSSMYALIASFLGISFQEIKSELFC